MSYDAEYMDDHARLARAEGAYAKEASDSIRSIRHAVITGMSALHEYVNKDSWTDILAALDDAAEQAKSYSLACSERADELERGADAHEKLTRRRQRHVG